MDPTSYQAAPPRVNELKLGLYKGKSRKGPTAVAVSPSGGAGYCPRSMPSIDQRHYVRSPLVKVSGRWSAGHPRPDKPSSIRPTTRRHGSRLAQICDTSGNAPGGLLSGKARNRSYAARARFLFAFVLISRVFYQEPEDLGTRH